MKSRNGIWKISTGKGNRIYINCEDSSQVMHPQSLCEANGLGMYGYENLKALAIAILIFEEEKQKSESIAASVRNQQKSEDDQDINNCNYSDKTLLKGYTALFGPNWKSSWNDASKIQEMKSIINGGVMPCVSFNRWKDCMNILNDNE